MFRILHPTADERIELLLQTTPAARRDSAEPLLGSIGLRSRPVRARLGASRIEACRLLHWAITGGESDPVSWPMHPDWARSPRDQYQAGDPFFFKQWGSWPHRSQPESVRIVEPDDRACSHDWSDGSWSIHSRKEHTGRVLDGYTGDEYPA